MIKGFSWKNSDVVFQRELAHYFNTPIGYIFLGIFITFISFMLFFTPPRYWDTGSSMRNFFDLLPIVYLFFIPAITMRLWADEKKSGTIEFFLTLPISETEAIIGKYLSAVAFLAIALLFTMPIAMTTIIVSNPDIMTIIGGYLGALLSGSAFIALGLYISWLTQDQINAFLLSFLASFFFFMLGYQPVLQFFGPLREIAAFFSISWHVQSLYRGLIDTRDILYFILFSLLFLYLNRESMIRSR